MTSSVKLATNKRWRVRRMAEGMCRRCIIRPVEAGKGKCRPCLDYNKAYMTSLGMAKRRDRMQTSLTANEQAKVRRIYAKRAMLTAKTGVMHHVDHVKPLAKGGRHHPDNLQILTAMANQLKGAHD